MHRHITRLKTLACGTLLGAVALLSAPAHASLATFDSSPLTAYNHGEKFQDGGLTFSTNMSAALLALGYTDGAAGVMLDSANPNSCGAINDCPSGGIGNFYGGTNDGSINVQRLGSTYSLRSLRFSYFTPLGGADDGFYGQLVLKATTADGTVVTRSADFANQDNDGHFQFSTWVLDNDFAALKLSDLNISACLFDGNGGCFNMADWAPFAAQFAIDDLDVELPLPGSAPLLLLGLAGLAALRRRAN